MDKNLMQLKQQYDKIDATPYGQNFADSIAILYHENSKLSSLLSRTLGERVSRFSNRFFYSRASQPYKIYPGSPIIPFEDFGREPYECPDLFSVISSRRSCRNFQKYNISGKELFLICHYSYGISTKTPIRELGYGSWNYRNVPSGGGLYPLELYFALFQGEYMPGLYHYRPDINALELIKEGDFSGELNNIITAEPIVNLKGSSCVFFVTSVFERIMVKYGDRGYRFILMETGFLSENLSLVCHSQQLGSCMIGGYLDDMVNNFLGINGLGETVQNVIVMGKGVDTQTTSIDE